MRGSRAASGAGRGGLAAGPLAQPERRGERGSEHRGGQRIQRGVDSGPDGQRRKREARGGGADGDRGLAQAEREPALVARKPPEHHAPLAAMALEPSVPATATVASSAG
jgi:hypothetical protein